MIIPSRAHAHMGAQLRPWASFPAALRTIVYVKSQLTKRKHLFT
jgi:hypothetical protein